MALNWMTSSKRKASTPPFMLQYRSSKGFILATVCFAVFTDIFLYSLIVPVIPFALSGRAGVHQEDVQHWVSVLIAVYGAALLVASPICGWLADHSKSRRLPLLIGLLALGASTVMLCIGSSLGVLVTGRFLQGLSAAVVWVVGLALLVDTVGEKEIGQVMGYVSLSMSIGILAGPLLGGVVYEKGGYYSVYAMAFGLIGLDILLRLIMVEKKIAKQWLATEEDLQDHNAGTEITSISKPSNNGNPIPSPANETSNQQPTHIPLENTNTPASRIITRLPPVITLLKSRRLLAALWGCLIQAALMTSFDSVLPLFVKRTFNWTSTGAGLIFLALFIPSFFAPLVGHLSDKHGPRYLATTGFLLALPILTLLRLITHNTLAQKISLSILLFLLGLTLTLVMPPLMAEITYVVQAKEAQSPGMFGKAGAYAQAYGLFNCAFAGGCLVGPIWAGFVVERAGWGTMGWSLGLLAGLSALPAFIWTGGLITKRHDKADHFRGEIYDDKDVVATTGEV